MPAQDTATFAVYSDRLSTANAIESLRAAGFRTTDIVALFPDEIGTWQFFPKRPTPFRKVIAAGMILGMALALFGGVWLAAGTAGTLLGMVLLGIGGSFIGAATMRRTEDYQERYESRVRHGDILVTVRCMSTQWAEKAKEILIRTHGDDVSTSDKVIVGSVNSNRIVVRPASEKTTARLRLVPRENARRQTVQLPRGVGGAPQKVHPDQTGRV